MGRDSRRDERHQSERDELGQRDRDRHSKTDDRRRSERHDDERRKDEGGSSHRRPGSSRDADREREKERHKDRDRERTKDGRKESHGHGEPSSKSHRDAKRGRELEKKSRSESDRKRHTDEVGSRRRSPDRRRSHDERRERPGVEKQPRTEEKGRKRARSNSSSSSSSSASSSFSSLYSSSSSSSASASTLPSTGKEKEGKRKEDETVPPPPKLLPVTEKKSSSSKTEEKKKPVAADSSSTVKAVSGLAPIRSVARTIAPIPSSVAVAVPSGGASSLAPIACAAPVLAPPIPGSQPPLVIKPISSSSPLPIPTTQGATPSVAVGPKPAPKILVGNSLPGEKPATATYNPQLEPSAREEKPLPADSNGSAVEQPSEDIFAEATKEREERERKLEEERLKAALDLQRLEELESELVAAREAEGMSASHLANGAESGRGGGGGFSSGFNFDALVAAAATEEQSAVPTATTTFDRESIREGTSSNDDAPLFLNDAAPTSSVPVASGAPPQENVADQSDEDEEDDDALFAALVADARAGAVAESAKLAEMAAKIALATEEPRTQVTAGSVAGTAAEAVAVPGGNALVVFQQEEEADQKIRRLDARMKEIEQRTKADGEKVKQLKVVDHKSIAYEEITKNFFVVPEGESKLTAEELARVRNELDGAKVWGQDVPPPIKTWAGIGLSQYLLDKLAELKFDAPFAVQALAIPVLMSGRDLVAQAKTGSGKTLAFLLPMLRHVMNQRRCGPGEGPIGLVMEPTHELAKQVYDVLSTLAGSKLKTAACYGGTNLAADLASIKGGVDILVATPGRLIDLLAANRGRSMNLSRCSFLVIDEADRLYDDGFIHSVRYCLTSARPDRVVALLSATIPAPIHKLMREQVPNAVEIRVDGKAAPSRNVVQHIEIFEDPLNNLNGDASKLQPMNDPRWKRLLQIIGENYWQNKLTLVFMPVKQDCDHAALFLANVAGYKGEDGSSKVGVLYAGMDQFERELAIKRFNLKDRPILIATSAAERGLDVPDLDLVVNYGTPNHIESYIHRVGRTGRAGRKGEAITIFTKGRDDFMASKLVAALRDSGNDVPEDLALIALEQEHLHDSVSAAGTGPGRERFKSNFDRGYRSSKKHQITADGRKAKSDDEESDFNDAEDDEPRGTTEAAGAKRKTKDPVIRKINIATEDNVVTKDQATTSTALALVSAATGNQLVLANAAGSGNGFRHFGAEAAQRYAETLTAAANDDPMAMLQTEFEINDFPDNIRLKLQAGYFTREVAAETDTSITVKGKYVNEKERNSMVNRSGVATSLKPGERKLYLQIRGKTEEHITKALRRFDALIEEVTAKAARKGSTLKVALPPM